MKKRIFTLLFGLAAMTTGAQADVAINATNFPDENFRNYLLAQDYGQDGVLTDAEIANVVDINVYGKGIKDLTGIKYFTGLHQLDCSKNKLTTLDVLDMEYLRNLTIYGNPLTSLKAPESLIKLNCGQQDLTPLNITQFKKLAVLHIETADLTSIDVSVYPELELLWLYKTNLRELNLSNPKLQELRCTYSHLTTLDFSKTPLIKIIRCHNNYINGDGMEALVNSLPTVTDGELYVKAVDEHPTIGNDMTTAQVAAAKAKGWNPTYYDSNDNTWKPYEGTSSGIAIDATNFPDANFRNYLLAQDYGQDAMLTDEEITNITGIYVSNLEISDLTGIEYFTAIEGLDCSNNQIKVLDLSKNTAIRFLTITNNPITTLNVRDDLESLFCGFQDITPFNITRFKKLTELRIESVDLKSFDPSNFEKLDYLSLYKTNLSTVDLSKNPLLTRFLCEGNNLTGLDFSNNPKIRYIECQKNQIRGAAMDALINSLPTVTEGELRAYDNIYEPEGNEITTVQVAAAKAKGWITKFANPKTWRWEEYEGSLPGIAIDATNFPDANFRNFLLAQDYGQDAMLTNEEIAAIKELHLGALGIKDLTGIGFFTALEVLECFANELTALDLSKNTKLTLLFISDNPLTSLQVTEDLKELLCGRQDLSFIDFTKFKKLTALSIFNVNLGSLDVSEMTELTNLNIEDLKLTSLDVSKNTKLVALDCNNNQLTSLDVSKNTKLSILQCAKNQLTSLDVSKNTDLGSLICYSNMIDVNAMWLLVSSLPTPSPFKGSFYVVDTTDPNEQNVITSDQVAAARAKNWCIWDYNGGQAGTGEYEGIPAGISTLTKEQLGGQWYTLDGRKLPATPTKKGVYIRNGKLVIK